METNINIADLVKPKFEVGQDVWVVAREYCNHVTRIQVTRIKAIAFKVEITKKGGEEVRVPSLTYICHGELVMNEDRMYASLNDIPEADRKPFYG